jgi:hypothetical protein
MAVLPGARRLRRSGHISRVPDRRDDLLERQRLRQPERRRELLLGRGPTAPLAGHGAPGRRRSVGHTGRTAPRHERSRCGRRHLPHTLSKSPRRATPQAERERVQSAFALRATARQTSRVIWFAETSLTRGGEQASSAFAMLRDRARPRIATADNLRLSVGLPTEAHRGRSASRAQVSEGWCGRGDSELDKGFSVNNLQQQRVAPTAQTGQMPGIR